MQLIEGVLHLWTLRLDPEGPPADADLRLLCPVETARSRRFRFDRDKRLFVAYRAHLRRILASYMGVRPESIRYEAGPQGKPAICRPDGKEWIGFNTSRSGELLVVGVARSREIGVDVEQIRPVPELDQIIADVCSNSEQGRFAMLRGEDRLAAFFRIWTQKEAYLKARGTGLNQPANQVEVSLAPIRGGLISDVMDADAHRQWSVKSFQPTEGYVAAAAARGHEWQPVYLGSV